MSLAVAKLLSLVALVALMQQEASSLRVVRVVTKYPVRYMVKGRPIRPFPRSFRLADVPARTAIAAGGAAEQQPAVIVLNETAVPFTVSKSALTTAEFEANPRPDSAPVEEGSGPAASFPDPAAGPSSLRHSPQSINEASAAPPKNTEPKIVDKTKDLNVEISEVHPVYVKPPTNFKPVIFATRRIDGVRSISSASVPLPSPPLPYPYPIPRGVSAWTLGGTRGVQRGSFWESLASDEALTVPSAGELASRSGKRKNAVIGGKPVTTYSWIILPNRRVTAYSKSVPVVAYRPVYSSKRVLVQPMPAYRHPLPPQRRRVTVAKPASAPKPSSSSNPSSSSTAIKSKLPVGLSSWIFGGVRDLNGKHWNMPELAVEKVDVVPASAAANPAHDNKRDFFNGKELMTSDEVETFEPATASAQPAVTGTFVGEVDESDPTARRPAVFTNVYFDEESDNVNAVRLE